jgi:hypothetical protein
MVGGGFHQRRTKQKKTYLLLFFFVDSLDEIIQCKHMFKQKKKELSQENQKDG